MVSVKEVQGNHSDSKGYGDVDNFVPWDNPDNVITLETFIAIRNIFFCYFNPLIFFIGVPANVLNCIVFFRQGLLLFPIIINIITNITIFLFTVVVIAIFGFYVFFIYFFIIHSVQRPTY